MEPAAFGEVVKQPSGLQDQGLSCLMNQNWCLQQDIEHAEPAQPVIAQTALPDKVAGPHLQLGHELSYPEVKNLSLLHWKSHWKASQFATYSRATSVKASQPDGHVASQALPREVARRPTRSGEVPGSVHVSLKGPSQQKLEPRKLLPSHPGVRFAALLVISRASLVVGAPRGIAACMAGRGVLPNGLSGSPSSKHVLALAASCALAAVVGRGYVVLRNAMPPKRFEAKTKTRSGVSN